MACRFPPSRCPRKYTAEASSNSLPPYLIALPCRALRRFPVAPRCQLVPAGTLPKSSATSFAISHLRERLCAQRLTRFAAADVKYGKAALRLLSLALLSFTRHRRGESTRTAQMSYSIFLFGKDHGTHANHIEESTVAPSGKRPGERDKGTQDGRPSGLG